MSFRERAVELGLSNVTALDDMASAWRDANSLPASEDPAWISNGLPCLDLDIFKGP